MKYMAHFRFTVTNGVVLFHTNLHSVPNNSVYRNRKQCILETTDCRSNGVECLTFSALTQLVG